MITAGRDSTSIPKSSASVVIVALWTKSFLNAKSSTWSENLLVSLSDVDSSKMNRNVNFPSSGESRVEGANDFSEEQPVHKSIPNMMKTVIVFFISPLLSDRFL